MQAVIFAGGLATRLGLITQHRPKSLVCIGGRPFLDYQLELLSRNGVNDVVLCLGHLGEQIEEHVGDGSRYGVTITCSREPVRLGTAGALKHAAPLLADFFFTLYGDSYTPIDFSALTRFFRSRKALALMTVYRNDGAYDRSNTVVARDRVVYYSKENTRPDMVYIDYGVNYFAKDVLTWIPEREFSGLEELFAKLIERGALLAYEAHERFYEIGSPEGLRDFERFATEVVT